MHEPTEPTVNEHGAETHPAFGMISAHRISSTPGQVLFDSDITHQHTVRISVQRATRGRDLHRDWIHETGRDLIEVELSEAQWASFVSSMNTSGVPCTLRKTESDWNLPGLVYDPRLALSMAETKDAADRMFRQAQAALEAYEQAVADKAPAKERAAKLRELRTALNNAEPNVTYAAKSLSEHAENVVQKARADIEAMVGAEAHRLGLEAGQAQGLLELPAVPGE